MSNADRIEELRSKYEENPRRYFAPLANEFRKAGDLAQAIAICREHLPKQPGHMSGYIVFGQTLFEANNLDEARSVFEQALSLDPENLIALKHLGDIARAKGENSIARRWYERVLDADPRNDDIASQLASLSAPTPPIAMPHISEPVATLAPLQEALGVFATFDPSSLMDLPDEIVATHHRQEEWEPQASASPRPIHHEPIDLDFPDDSEPVEAAIVEEEFEEGLLAPEWPDTSELVARIITPVRSATPISTAITDDALAAFGRESHETVSESRVDVPPADNLVEAFLPSKDVASDDIAESDFSIEGQGAIEIQSAHESEIVVETESEFELENALVSVHGELFEAEQSFAAVSSELETESDAEEVEQHIADAAPVESEQFANSIEAEQLPDVVEAEPLPDAVQAEQFPLAVTAEQLVEEVEARSEQAAPGFVTETMAELLVAQGFLGRAIEIYEELVRLRGDDLALVARLGELRIQEAAVVATSQPTRTPRYNTPIRNTPQYVTPQHATPQFSAPQSNTPQYVTPQYSTPQYSTPQFSTPLSTTPLSSPVAVHPYATPNAGREQVAATRTARERFAALARRRVPRRTPTHATAVADDPADGLSSLFGTTQPTSPDELAARTLADAFGPVQDTGESLFDLSSTPTPAVPLRALTPRSATPLHSTAMASSHESRGAPQANADYSFDRFFPDPAVASKSMQPSAPSVGSESSPPANEDLAQFSAWLKGLNGA